MYVYRWEALPKSDSLVAASVNVGGDTGFVLSSTLAYEPGPMLGAYGPRRSVRVLSEVAVELGVYGPLEQLTQP